MKKILSQPLTKRQIQEIILVFFLLIVTAVISIFSAYIFSTMDIEKPEKTQTTYEYPEELHEFIELYNRITEGHYVEVEKDILIKGAMEGLLEAFEDEYTSYIDEYENYQFQQRVQGQYRGIGISLYDNDDDEIEITDVFADSPAERAGVAIGDIIVGIEDEDLTDKDTQFLVEYIRDSDVDTVTMVFLRNGEEVTLEVDVQTVVLPSVESEIITKDDYKVGYLTISIFALNTFQQFRDQLQVLEEEVDGLVINLRYNTGGYLSTAERIISAFLDSSHVIYRTEENDEEKLFYSRGSETKDYPIVVLGNSYSASASEILIAALQEAYGATFVGTQTYGKGTVQEMVDLDNDDALRYTARIWLTPDGNWIDGEGIEPDYEIEQDPEFLLTQDRNLDVQLQKALEVLLNKLN